MLDPNDDSKDEMINVCGGKKHYRLRIGETVFLLCPTPENVDKGTGDWPAYLPGNINVVVVVARGGVEAGPGGFEDAAAACDLLGEVDGVVIAVPPLIGVVLCFVVPEGIGLVCRGGATGFCEKALCLGMNSAARGSFFGGRDGGGDIDGGDMEDTEDACEGG
jgi:hypothetical protein